MFGRIGILLWKEKNNRSILGALLSILLPVVIVIFINLKFLVFTDCFKVHHYYRDFHIPAKLNKSNLSECQSPKRPSEIVAYEPSNALLEMMVNETFCRAFNKENDFSIKANLDGNFTFGVKFSGIEGSDETLPKFLDYVMYPTEEKSKYPSEKWIYSGSLFRGFVISSTSPASTIQKYLNGIFLRKIQAPSVDVTVTVQYDYLHPSECRIIFVWIVLLPMLFFILENNRYLKILVQEKKSGLKIYLQVMGFVQYQIKLAGLFFPMIIHLSTITLVTFFLYFPLQDVHYVLYAVHPAWMVLLLILSAVNLTIFQYFLSIFFQNELYSSFVSILLTLLPPMSLLAASESYATVSDHFDRFLCLIPSLCLVKGFALLIDFETYGKSVKFLEKLSPETEFSLTVADIVIMNIVSSVLYFLLGLYFEKIIPGNQGVTLPYNFLFKKSYWKAKKSSIIELGNEGTAEQNKEMFEAVQSDLKVAISVKNVGKKYRNGVVALDNVSINFFEGEIIGLLGHNGAGKTTLFSILCGMTTASYGEVAVFGSDIKNTDRTKSFGYCPQYDILINATVFENIVFFGMAKGLKWKEARKEAKAVISQLGLGQSKNVRAPKLSGGQRRKLSLAVALTGNPQVVLLDEPTTGIDTTMRRQIWNVLLELRGRKTVILCTHLLEEADALCNRIAVLNHGKVHCYGSPMFLKSKYGTGFALSIVAPDTGKANAVTGLVKKFISTAQFKYQNMMTLVFKLPEKELSNFPALFEELDVKKSQNEIVSYSITVSTMEDVFLNINSALKEEYEAQRDRNEGDVVDTSNDEYEKKKLRGVLLFGYRIYALFIKKWIYVYRHLITYFFIFGFLIGLNAFYASLFSSEGSEKKVIRHSLSLYGKPEILYTSDTSQNHLIDSFEKVIVNSGATFRKVDNIKEEQKKLLQEDFTKFSKTLITIQFLKDKIEIKRDRLALHALPVIVNLVTNAFLHSNGSHVESGISFERFKMSSTSTGCQWVFASFFLFLLFDRYIFLMAPLEERKTEVKTLQLLLVSPISYWISHLIFDLAILIVFAIVCCTVMAYVNDIVAGAILADISGFAINLLLYCIAILLMMYILSTIFSSYSSCAMVDMFLFGATAPTFMKPEVFQYAKYLSPTTLWFTALSNFCTEDRSNPNLKPVIDHPYYLGRFCLVAFCILILIDIGILRKIFHKSFTYLYYCLGIVRFKYEHPKDETVENEKETVKKLIKNKQLSTKILAINNLKKWYCSCICKKCACCKYGCIKQAVKGVSFAMEKGECFGLVGTNGAGKTSIFGILTGALIPSFGAAYMESTNLSNCFCKYKTFSRMGYCPQFSCVLPAFKGREMLQLFGRLRGCSRSLLKEQVKKWIVQTNLEEYQNKKCGNYSGGNKRKLSVGMAFIGNPKLVLLDEPTTGIDAAGRRLIWDLIGGYREKEGSVLLTSHSMEECETLCSRLTIMTKGQMRVIGETTTLKAIYGQGYSVLLKLTLNATDEQRADLQKAMENTFGEGCQLTDIHLTVLQYEITKETASWKKLFADLNTMKSKFAILESYFVSSTTLEQIFMNFSKD